MEATILRAKQVEQPPDMVTLVMTLAQARQLKTFFGQMGGGPNEVVATVPGPEKWTSAAIKVPKAFRQVTSDPLWVALDKAGIINDD